MRTLLALALVTATLPRGAACEACHGAPAPAVAAKPVGSPAAPGGAGIDVGGCCGKPDAAPAKPSESPGHPLKGVIVDILNDRSALLVKHEEIPGVMRAMTMLLKVDAPTLAAARKGQSITAILLRKSDGWWLETVTPVASR